MNRDGTPRAALLGFRLLVAMLVGIHGWYRLLHGGSPPFGDWLASQGVPLPHAIAWSITFGEILGSACLALGVSRRTLIRWTKTRGLTPRGKDTRGRNLYNLADLWAAQAARTPPRAPE